MPTYNFECKKCGASYEDLTNYDATGKYADVQCPVCNSKRKKQIPSTCNFVFAQPQGTSRWISDSTGHDYRYKHNQPNVRKQRENAEKKSHMGGSKDIYRQMNDIDNDQAYDFSKI